MPKELSDKRQLFVQEYCTNGFNAAAAYKIAYPDCKAGHNALASRLKANDSIQQAIDTKKAEIAAKIEVDFKWLTAKRLAAVQTAEQKKDLGALDRHLQALEKHKGYYEQDNAQKTVQQAIQVNIDTPEALEQGIDRLKRLREERKAIDTEYEDAEDAICKE